MGPGDVAHIAMNEVHGTCNTFEEAVVFLAILSRAKFDGTALVDVCRQGPWASHKVPIDYE